MSFSGRHAIAANVSPTVLDISCHMVSLLVKLLSNLVPMRTPISSKMLQKKIRNMFLGSNFVLIASCHKKSRKFPEKFRPFVSHPLFRALEKLTFRTTSSAPPFPPCPPSRMKTNIPKGLGSLIPTVY